MDDYSSFRSAAELKAGVLMWQIVPPMLMVMGTLGNIMSIIILSKRRFNKWPSSAYLIGLSIADLTVIYVGLLRQWVKYTFDKDVRFADPVLCKIHWWLMYATTDTSVWILTTVNVERLISAICPYKSKVLCTPKHAKVVVVAVAAFALAFDSHLLYGFGKLEIVDGNNTIIIPCTQLTVEYADFFNKIWAWIDLCKFSIIPFIVVSVGNASILAKVFSSHRKVNPQHLKSTDQDVQTRQRVSNMSLLMITLNMAFIVSTLPVCVYFIGEPYWIPDSIPRNIQLQDPWWALVNLLMYFNHSCNFILYCLTGSRFRNEVKKIFCKKEKTSETTVSTIAGRTLISGPV